MGKTYNAAFYHVAKQKFNNTIVVVLALAAVTYDEYVPHRNIRSTLHSTALYRLVFGKFSL